MEIFNRGRFATVESRCGWHAKPEFDSSPACHVLPFSCLRLVVRLSTQRGNILSGWKKGESVEAEKVRFSYYCTSCETRHKTVSQGMCPTCGSQAIVPVGWYRRSPDERKEWFQRIRGEHRKDPFPPALPQSHDEKNEKPKE